MGVSIYLPTYLSIYLLLYIHIYIYISRNYGYPNRPRLGPDALQHRRPSPEAAAHVQRLAADEARDVQRDEVSNDWCRAPNLGDGGPPGKKSGFYDFPMKNHGFSKEKKGFS